MVICFLGADHHALAQLQPQEQGDPFIRNYSPREYGAFHQNWCVVQDLRGLIYVGNNSGVLEYDGVRWRLIRTNKGTLVRSLAVDASGRVYVGAQGEFGYLAPNANGEMRFVSLMDHVAPADRAISDIWSICFLGDRVYFQSFERLFCLSGNRVQVWKPAKAFQIACTVRNRLYICDVGRGLLVLDGDVMKPVSGGECFTDKKIRALLPWDIAGAEQDGLLVCTQGQGLFLSDGKMVNHFPTQADAAMREGQLYHALLLADGTLGVATLQGGFMHLSRDGRWLGRVGEKEGLPAESIKYLFQDSQLGLWLALQKGISRVEIPAPLTCFDERRGLRGTVFSIHRHQGTLYVGTDQGLFRLNPAGPRGPFFSSINGLKGAVWRFISWGDSLLVANYDGVFEVRGTRVMTIRKSATVSYYILRSRKDPERLFVGLQNGLASCRLEGGRWVDEGFILDMPIQVRSLYEAEDGSLWVGTTYAQGVLHISFPDGVQHGNPRVERFGTESGLPSLNHTNVYNLAGGLKVTSHAGIYRYRADSRCFELDPLFSGLFPKGQRWIYDLEEDSQGRVWMHSCDEGNNINESGAAVPQPGGTYRWEGRPCIRFSGNWVTVILPEVDGVVWFGSEEGLMRLDSKIPKPYDQSFHAHVRRVSTGNERTIFWGTWSGPPAESQIPYADNRFRFEFATTSFDLESANCYQVLLEGYDADWSAWNMESFKEYTNLPEGSYRFHVRARNLYGTLSSVDTYAFKVLPPWYRSWWAYILWIIGGGAALVGIIYLYTLKLRRQKDLLKRLVAKRTQALVEANDYLENLFDYANAPIIVWDPQFRITRFNHAFETLSGRVSAGVLGKRLEILFPPEQSGASMELIQKNLSGERREVVEINIQHLDGSIRTVLWNSATLLSADGKIPIATISQIQDITRRKIAEEKIKNLLAEKELILQEVHHRIKNNMATVTGLFYLQANTLKNPDAIAALKDAGSRVQSMVVLYEKLYQSIGSDQVEVRNYLPYLVDEIVANFPNSAKVKVVTNIADFVLNAIKLQPLGIIINELLTNIMKYAFIGRSDGLITVSAELQGNRVSLAIQDNGIGMPDTVDFENSTGFGLRLVSILTKQLAGTIRIEHGKGTRIILEFLK